MTSKFLRSRSTLGVKNVPESIAFYTETLGFKVQTSMGEPASFAVLERDDVGLALVQQAKPAVAEFAGTYFNVENVEELHERCKSKGATIANPLTRQPWGNYDFVVRDPDGHQLALGEAPEAGNH